MANPFRILLIGASGTLGRAIATQLGARHKIIFAGRSNADVILDISDPDSIRKGLKKAGELDAVVCAAGQVAFAPFADFQVAPFSDSLYALGLTNKLMGQVNLTLAARDVLSDRGSITLISGILSRSPVAEGTSASMVNGALESFVRAAAIELPRGLRINCVSPSVLVESMEKYAPFFRGFEPVPAVRAAVAFSRSVEGLETGQVYRVE
jgi:NAD(P)-dependent dehydrogenase (short-subunit alcohol dehydrogenase family)